MNIKSIRHLLLLLPRQIHHHNHHHHQQHRSITKVRLKWVKNKTLDHIIDTHTDLKAAMLLKDAIKHSPTSFITSQTFTNWQRPLGLTVPVIRFLRRYPTLFHEFPHPRYRSLSCFRLTDLALALDEQERGVYAEDEMGVVERICRAVMMMRSGFLPLRSLLPLKWDLGLPYDVEKSILVKYPEVFRVEEGEGGSRVLRLVQRKEEYAVSRLQMGCEVRGDYSEFRKGGRTGSGLGMTFAMSFPRGYGGQKKVRAWMEEFNKLPYISPYEDSSRIDPNSEIMEKRVVGVLHEFLSLTIHKMTKRNYLRCLREELNLPHRFTRIFTRYPGIFYLSLKCKTTTVTLKEGYRKGKLVDPHPLVGLRDKFYYVMRSGLLYRGKGVKSLPPQDCVLDSVGNDKVGDGSFSEEEEGTEMEEECWDSDNDFDD